MEFSSPPQTILVLCAGILASAILFYLPRRKQIKSTSLPSPPNPSFLFGTAAIIKDADAASAAYEKWAQAYGSVYMVPAALGKVTTPCFRPVSRKAG
jgi:hypothetical protein